jgi:hypothetical protein
MTMRDEWTVPSLLAAFDEHLLRHRGLTSGTRVNYVRHVGAFVVTVAVGRRVEPPRRSAWRM